MTLRSEFRRDAVSRNPTRKRSSESRCEIRRDPDRCLLEEPAWADRLKPHESPGDDCAPDEPGFSKSPSAVVEPPAEANVRKDSHPESKSTRMKILRELPRELVASDRRYPTGWDHRSTTPESLTSHESRIRSRQSCVGSATRKPRLRRRPLQAVVDD